VVAREDSFQLHEANLEYRTAVERGR
jgi:hypothetical protein